MSTRTQDKYREIETIRDPDGVIAIITERVSTGHLSFKILKEYEDRGEIKTTPYLARRHIEAVRRVTERVQDRLDVHNDRLRVGRAR